MSFSPDGKTLLFIDIDTNENLSFHVGGETITNYDNILLYKYPINYTNFIRNANESKYQYRAYNS